MKMEKDLKLDGCTIRCRERSGVNIHDVDKENFEKLKKLGEYDSYEGTKWVVWRGVTFFASHKRKGVK